MIRVPLRSFLLVAPLLVTLSCTTSEAGEGGFNLVEATIPEMQRAMEEGRLTSRQLVELYLQRIAMYEDKINAVITVNPHALEEGGLVVLRVNVLTTSDLYTDTVEIGLNLGQRQPGLLQPFAVSTGLNNVPVNQRVLLYGKSQATYDWAFASRPFASDAVLRDFDTTDALKAAPSRRDAISDLGWSLVNKTDFLFSY